MRCLLWLSVVSMSACCSITRNDLCRTRCGVISYGSCDDLQKTETVWLAGMGLFADMDEAKACGAMLGWMALPHEYKKRDTVVCSEGAWWMPRGGFCVLGYTHAAGHWIEVQDTDYRHNSYAHELVHATELSTLGTAGHCGWEERGIKTAIRFVTGEDDLSEPEADCLKTPPETPTLP